MCFAYFSQCVHVFVAHICHVYAPPINTLFFLFIYTYYPLTYTYMCIYPCRYSYPPLSQSIVMTYETYFKLTGHLLKNTTGGVYPSILNEQNIAFINQLQDIRQISSSLCQCIYILQYNIYTYNITIYPYNLLDRVYEILKIFCVPETLFSARCVTPGSEISIISNLLRLFTYVSYRIPSTVDNNNSIGGNNYDPSMINTIKIQHIQKLFNDLFIYYERFNSIYNTYSMNLSYVSSHSSHCSLLMAVMDFISVHSDVCIGYIYSIPQMCRYEVCIMCMVYT